MISKRKIATTAATFGAAMTSMHAAPELQAQIQDLTWQGGNATATNDFVAAATSSPQEFGIDQVIDQALLTPDFNQWNDTYNGTGRTMNVGGGRNIMSARVVALGDTLDPATFAGTGTTSAGLVAIVGQTEFDGTGPGFLGFRDVTGNVGWFRMDYMPGMPIVYSDGELGSGGETLTVGGTTGGGGFVEPTDFTVFRGTQISGTLSDFAASDDVSATYNPGFTINNLEAPVWLIFDGNAPSATSFRVESNAGTPGLTYTVEAFNFNANTFDVIGTQAEAFNSDGMVDFNLVPADHIAADGSVQARVGWRQTGFVINFPWEVLVDQAGWNQ